MSSRDALIIALPAGGVDSDRAPWWRVIDGQVTQTGDDLGWLHPSAGGPLAEETHVIGIAPAADVMLHRAAFSGLTSKQAEAAAKLLAAEASLSSADTLHVAIGAAQDDGARDIAAVDVGTMARWLAFAQGHGLDMASVVPAALLVTPSPDPDTLVRAHIGDELLLRGTDSAFIADPVLVEHIAGKDRRIVDASAETIEAGLIAACDSAPVELRSARFARKPASWFDRDLAKRAAMLVAAILVISLLIAVARIGRLYAEIAGIDAAAEAQVAEALASPPPLDQAIPQLDARLAALGGGPARLSTPLAALVSRIEQLPNVSITSLGWSGDGVLSATLAAPRVEDMYPALIALQTNDGYRVEVPTRTAEDGRTVVDLTMRAAR